MRGTFPPAMAPHDDLPPDYVPDPRDVAVGEACDYCGAERLVWRKCKLVCLQCRQINKSCADL